MAALRPWFGRRFESGLPPEAMAEVIERLRGTPARLEERLQQLPTRWLIVRFENKWSMQENAGHLFDLEPLWSGRLDDLLAGARELRPADLQNRKTDEANHNARALAAILSGFRNARTRLVVRLEDLDDSQLAAKAWHPRLHEPMTTVDLFFFVAEHDDHHLARITRIHELAFGSRVTPTP